MQYIEESYQKLQEKLRTTVLDSADIETQLREKMKALDETVVSLTVTQNLTFGVDDKMKRLPRMNAPIRGATAWKTEESSITSACYHRKFELPVTFKSVPYSRRTKTKHQRPFKTCK